MRFVFSNLEFRLHLSKTHLMQAISDRLLKKEQKLQLLNRALHEESPSARIKSQEQHLHLLVTQLKHYMHRTLEQKQAAFAEQATLLHSVSPLATLARGYAIVRKKHSEDTTWRVVSRAKDAGIGEELKVLLHEGQLDCVVTRNE